MVKNKKGGSGHKKMASKHSKDTGSRNRKVRIPTSGEMLAKVQIMYGGPNCKVICNDKVSRLMVIRKKFTGRRRRDNNIGVDSVVLIGIREYEVLNNKKLQKVDLLEVYAADEVEELYEKKLLNDCILPEKQQSVKSDMNIPFDITDEEDIPINKKINKEEKSNKYNNKPIGKSYKNDKYINKPLKQKEIEEEEPEIDWDNI